MTCSLLDVSERDARGEGRGDERMPERVRADGLVDPGFAGEAADDPPGGVSVQPLPVVAEEDRTLDPFTDSEVDRARCAWCEWDGGDLAALAIHGQGATRVPQLMGTRSGRVSSMSR